jgi:hypothetical protein
MMIVAASDNHPRQSKNFRQQQTKLLQASISRDNHAHQARSQTPS